MDTVPTGLIQSIIFFFLYCDTVSEMSELPSDPLSEEEELQVYEDVEHIGKF
jgi:hypothetical protein